MRLRWLVPVMLFAAVVAAPVAQAHGGGPQIQTIATGLDSPRHLAFGPWGDLYVAEAGRGGDGPCFAAAEGPACMGAIPAPSPRSTAGATRRGSPIGLASFANTPGNVNAIGPHGIRFATGNSVFITNGGPTEPQRGDPPRDGSSRATSSRRGPGLEPVRAAPPRRRTRSRKVVDVWAFERHDNPDAAIGNPAVDSNAVDVLLQGPPGHRRRWRQPATSPTRELKSTSRDCSPTSRRPTGSEARRSRCRPCRPRRQGARRRVLHEPAHRLPVPGRRRERVPGRPADGRDEQFATGFRNIMDLAFGREGTLNVLEIDSDGLLPPVGPQTEGALFAIPPGGGDDAPARPAGRRRCRCRAGSRSAATRCTSPPTPAHRAAARWCGSGST